MELELPEGLLEEALVPATKTDLKYDEIVREIVPLEKDDLEALELLGPSRSQSVVQHLRAYHHNVALRLAAGEKAVEICASLGLQPSTINRLEKSEQFRELVSAYRERIVDRTVDHSELMSLVSAESLMAMHERLTGTDRDEIPLEALRRISETFVDRIGHSPIRRSETLSRHTHELTRETIDRIKKLHGEDTTYEAETLEASAIEVHEIESESAGAGGSIAAAFEPVAEKKANGGASEGPSLREQSSEVPET